MRREPRSSDSKLRIAGKHIVGHNIFSVNMEFRANVLPRRCGMIETESSLAVIE